MWFESIAAQHVLLEPVRCRAELGRLAPGRVVSYSPHQVPGNRREFPRLGTRVEIEAPCESSSRVARGSPHHERAPERADSVNGDDHEVFAGVDVHEQ
jgi:hypothetical protein